MALSLLWMGTAAMVDAQNGGILAGKMALLLSLPNTSTLILLTGALGGLLGGLGALSGQQLRTLLTYKRPEQATHRH